MNYFRELVEWHKQWKNWRIRIKSCPNTTLSNKNPRRYFLYLKEVLRVDRHIVVGKRWPRVKRSWVMWPFIMENYNEDWGRNFVKTLGNACHSTKNRNAEYLKFLIWMFTTVTVSPRVMTAQSWQLWVQFDRTTLLAGPSEIQRDPLVFQRVKVVWKWLIQHVTGPNVMHQKVVSVVRYTVTNISGVI
jgi:hypothetical protein